MDKFELTDENCKAFMGWLDQSEYSWNTKRVYKSFLKRVQKKYDYIALDNLLGIMRMAKHQNQRAVLHAINKFSFDNTLGFHVPIPKVKAKPRKLPTIIGNEEIKTLVNSVDSMLSLQVRCIFNMGAGLRVSEVLKLSWNHIRWAEWVNTRDSFGVAVIRASKGDKDRIVNIPPKLMLDLYALAEKRGILNEFAIPEGGMIFWIGDKTWKKDLFKENEKEWRNQYIRHAYSIFRYEWNKACLKILGRIVNVHSLRHSRATYLYEVEHVPIERIQLLLGHSSLDTTMIYTKVNPLSTFEIMKNTKEI